jgi:hypothetical protein
MFQGGILPLCPEEVGYSCGCFNDPRNYLWCVANRIEMKTRGYTPWCCIPFFTTSLTTERRRRTRISVNPEGSKFMLSSLNNTVSDLYSLGVSQASRERERPESQADSTHPQGVTTTSLQRERSHSTVESSHPQGVAPTSLHGERSQSHVESMHSQGVAPTSLLRKSSTSHVDSQARSATGSSDVLDLVSRRRSTASRRPSFAPSATARAGERFGDAREAPAHKSSFQPTCGPCKRKADTTTRLWVRSVGGGEVARMAVTRIRHQRHQCRLMGE